MDLKAFRLDNGITQEELGEFLGVKKSFISSIEHGSRPLPYRHIKKIIENEKGWDTGHIGPLPPRSVSAIAVNHSTASVSVGENIEVAVLRKEVELLRNQNEELKEMVKVLSKALENTKTEQYGKE